jgi:hypothetical protein
MYFVLESIPQNADVQIIDHVNGRVNALQLLEGTARKYIEKQCGESHATSTQLMEVDGLSTITIATVEIDGLYMFKLKTDSDKIYVYKRVTKINRGYVINSIDTSIAHVKTYSLAQYDIVASNVNTICRDDSNGSINYVSVKSNIKMPQQMRISPYIDMMVELASNSKFLSKKIKFE